VVKQTCIGCKVPLTGKGAVCQHCKEKESMTFMRNLIALRKSERSFHQLWTQCQRCQGSLTQEVLCSNRDCPIFYRRTKARKDMEKALHVVGQFV